MAVIETWLRQDLKGLVTVRSLQGQVFSLDNGGNLIGVKVTKDGQPVTLTGTVTGYCILSDGQTVTVTGSGKSGIQNGNEAYIVLPQLVYSVPGQISIVIKLTSGSVTTTLAACTGYVYRSRTSNEVVPPGTPIPDLATLEEAISRANTATDNANTAASSANNSATAAENVNVAMNKSGKVITITATNRSGTSTSHTVTEPTLTVQRANNVVTVTATDADGQTSIEFDAVDADEVAELKEAVSTKAEEDGYYEELTAGSAEQLVSTEAVTDTTPYLYRKSGGSVDIGNRETLEKIVGGTVAWNQLVKLLANENWSAESGVTATYEEGIATVTSTTNGNGLMHRTAINVLAHKYLVTMSVYGTSGVTAAISGIPNSSQICIDHVITKANTWETATAIVNSRLTGRMSLYLLGRGGTYENLKFKNVQIYDLTAMFGPTIADYIYNLEQTTAGAGVAWFRKLFPKDYYPYNPGELISVKTASHDMVGFNLWDEGKSSIGFVKGAYRIIPLPPIAKTNELYMHFEDKDTSVALNSSTSFGFVESNTDVPLLPNAYNWVLQGGTVRPVQYHTNLGRLDAIIIYPNTEEVLQKILKRFSICINISHSGSRNGEYEPYEKHSYPLANVELRGPLAIDADGKLVYSGDEYPPSGQVARKYGLVDLGTVNWESYTSSGNVYLFKAVLNNFPDKFPGTSVINAIASSSKVVICSQQDWPNGFYQLSGFNGATTNLLFTYNDNDVSHVKAYLSDVYLLYELATPTTEQVAPYTPVQVVDDWGTEEFVDTREVAIPVGHSTSYMANLRDKLQHLPSLAEEDGEYIVKQTGTKMELAKLSSSGLAQSIYESVESTPIVSFKDGADGQAMKVVNVAIEPMQDLHGYDSPWPAGGGKNLLNNTASTISKDGLTFTVNNDGSVMVNGTATANTELALTTNAIETPGNYIVNGCPAGNRAWWINFKRTVNGASGWLQDYGAGVTVENATIQNVGIYVTNGTQVNNIHFKPMIRLASVSDATFAPYSNICPISGWTGAKVTRTGKNLLPVKFYTGFGYNDTVGQVMTLVADESVTRNGNVFSKTVSTWGGTGMISEKLKPGTYKCNIAFSADTAGNTRSSLYVFDENFKIIRRIYNLQTSGTWTNTITISEGEAYIAVNVSNMSTGTVTITSPQIEIGSTATAYEPYKGQTYEVTFPTEAGTVYGGTLDVVRGKLVVDRVIANMPDMTWINTIISGTKMFYTYPTPTIPIKNKGVCKSEIYKTGIGDKGNTGTNVIMNGWPGWFGSSIVVRKSSDTTDEAFATEISGKKIVYEIASPIEYTLTPQEIKTLLGANNIWSNAGDTAVTYPADTKLYIDNKIAELQALVLENNG